MIIDSFLFFQELDLLEIRLSYLNEFVDKFLIVESCQSFNGQRKEFIFEKNKSRFNKYLDKIFYYKICDFHNNPNNLFKFLSENKSEEKKSIYKILKNHKHYNKELLWWILDSYHRECIHLGLNKICKISDQVIISDIDEIPSRNFFKSFANTDQPIVFQQREFKYYLNSYNNFDWFGSIIAPYSFIKDKSLNQLRRNSKEFKKKFKGGYHFTSMGGEILLKTKIESYSHQEFNIPEIKNNLRRNLYTGRDIFYRLGERKNIIVDINKTNRMDLHMRNIIYKYPDLILQKTNKENIFDKVRFRFTQIKIYIKLIKKNPNKLFLKTYKFLLKISKMEKEN